VACGSGDASQFGSATDQNESAVGANGFSDGKKAGKGGASVSDNTVEDHDPCDSDSGDTATDFAHAMGICADASKDGFGLVKAEFTRGFNDKAERRSVVMHGAPYVSEDFAAQHGRLGRSWGCPALSQKVAPKVIDTIKGGSLVFSYFPDQDWLAHSQFVASAAGTFAAGTH